MQSYPIKKSFLSTPKLQLPTAPKLTCNSPFRIPLATVSLQYNNPFFENSQSCVSTKVTLSHRFKSSPAIPGKVALSGVAGYIMMAGHFRENHVSSGDLNRRSQDGVVSLKHGRLAHVRSQFSLFRRSPTHKNLPPATFCASEHVLFGCFLHNAKSDNPFSLQRTSRFCKPRCSSPQWRLRSNKIKSFCRHRRHFFLLFVKYKK